MDHQEVILAYARASSKNKNIDASAKSLQSSEDASSEVDSSFSELDHVAAVRGQHELGKEPTTVTTSKQTKHVSSRERANLDFDSHSEKSKFHNSVVSGMRGDATTYKKYLQATDFLELQMSGIRKPSETKPHFVKIFIALLDFIDFEKAAHMILERQFFEEFL